MMEKDIVDLAKRLISIPSVTGDNKALEQVLELAVKECSFGLTVKKFKKNASPSVLVYKGKKMPAKFRLILNAHLDVVNGKPKQFTPVIKAKRLYGRGADDMKAAAACEILVFKKLVQKVNYPLALQLVTDEETGGFNGTKYQIEQGIKADFVIAGETTKLNIVNQAKGIIWFKVKAHGKNGHGAYPWVGKNALWQIHSFLTKLKKTFPEAKRAVWKTTFNLAKITTPNQTINQIPDVAEAWFDCRYIPKEKEVVLKKLVQLAKQEQLEIVMQEPDHYVDKQNLDLKKLKTTIQNYYPKKGHLEFEHGASDLRHYGVQNIAAVEFGPIGFGGHSDNEYVDIPSLKTYSQILSQFILDLN